MKRLHWLPIFVALVMSVVSSRLLFVGSGLSLIPWGVLALCFGLIAKTSKDAVRLGAIYGFSQAFIFLWIDKAGRLTLPQFFALVAIISGLGILAAGCAAIASRIGYFAKSHLQK